MTKAKTPTKLRIDEWARLIGISPVHFSGGVVAGVWEYPERCIDAWQQYDWQSTRTASREHLALTVANCERELENLMGFPIQPTYYSYERIPYPRRYDGRSQLNRIPLETKWKKLIQLGQQTNQLYLSNIPVVYSDGNNDTYDETATLIFAWDDDLDLQRMRFYHVGRGGVDEFRVYPKSIKRTSADVVTVVFDAWILLDPEIWENPPALAGILDLAIPEFYVDALDVWGAFQETTLPVGRMGWTTGNGEGPCFLCSGVGCTVCGTTTQTLCGTIVDAAQGRVRVFPATYLEDDETWREDQFTIARDPDYVELCYSAGDIEPEYLARRSLDPLRVFWAETIMWLAGARLRFPVCACNGAEATVEDLRRNMVAVDGRRQTYISILAPDMLTNPFGTKFGEVQAWNRVGRMEDIDFNGGVI